MPRVHAELVLGRERVERLMRTAGGQGTHRRRRLGYTNRDPKAGPNSDLVQRALDPAEPNRLWCMEVIEHWTSIGKIYVAVVLDAFSRRVVDVAPVVLRSLPEPDHAILEALDPSVEGPTGSVVRVELQPKTWPTSSPTPTTFREQQCFASAIGKGAAPELRRNCWGMLEATIVEEHLAIDRPVAVLVGGSASLSRA